VGDDGLTIEAQDGVLYASPPPRIAGLIEVRNVGLLARPVASRVPVALALLLDPAAVRLPEAPETMLLDGIELPHLTLWPDSPVLALRVEAALEWWGLLFAARQVHMGTDHDRT
jgi:serine kinase of HPr protein (carbohydrate metabolism regulator)